MNINKTKLRPVIYTTDSWRRGAPQTTQQVFLLRALRITQDPKELRKMIGVRTVAEVYRTLDKLAIRKEYHAALARNGISFDFLVDGIKKEAEGGEKSADRIKAFQILLKSIGLDKYDDTAASGGTWEEELLKSMEAKNGALSPTPTHYEVIEPPKPERVKKAQEEDEEIMKGIYE